MNFKKGYLQGSITVYLTLLLFVILSFLMVLLQASRIRTMKTRTEIAMDCGVQSLLADYHQELFRQFDFFYLDSSYGRNIYGNGFMEERLRDVLEYNVRPEKRQYFLYTSDFYGLTVVDAEITQYQLATDNQGAPIRKQAIWIMKKKTGIPQLSLLLQQLKDVEKSKESQKQMEEVLQEYESNKEELFRHKKSEKESENTDDTQVFLQMDQAINKRLFSLMAQIFGKDQNFSEKSVYLDQYPSRRVLWEGSGQEPIETDETPLSNLLFGEYLLSYFGNYTNQKETSYLTYQTEYILSGKSTDYENLEAVVQQIFLLREGSNFMYLHTDEKKEGFVKQVSALLCTLLGIPQFQDLVKNMFLFLWAYGESMEDMKKIMDGEKIIFFKTEETWQLSLTDFIWFSVIQDFFSNLIHDSQSEDETTTDNKKITEEQKSEDPIAYFDYTTYLRIFLFCLKTEEKTMRMMDLIEMDIRQTKGNEFFRLDACYDWFQATAWMKSRYGDQFTITRTGNYETIK